MTDPERRQDPDSPDAPLDPTQPDFKPDAPPAATMEHTPEEVEGGPDILGATDATPGTEEVAPAVSDSELTLSARIGGWLFRHRGWLPLLFLAIPIIVRGTPSPFRWQMGVFLILVGETFRLAGVAAAGPKTRRRSRHVEQLVTHGIFAWSRNPLYLGNFLVWMGFVVISGVLWFLPAAVLLFGLQYSLIVAYEEGVLESIFEREYLDYKQCTPRWFPRKPQIKSSGPVSWGAAVKSEMSTFMQYAALFVAFAIKDSLSH